MGRATVDGVVAIGLADDHPEVEQIRRAGVPIVLVDSSALPDHGSIEVDDEGGARTPAEHVIGLGHRDVLIVGVEPPAPSTALDPDSVTGRRLRGYREAFEAAGVDHPGRSRRRRPGQHRRRDRRARAAWADGLRPTAVLAMSDAMAIGVDARRCAICGLAIPGDVSIVGSTTSTSPSTSTHR